MALRPARPCYKLGARSAPSLYHGQAARRVILDHRGQCAIIQGHSGESEVEELKVTFYVTAVEQIQIYNRVYNLWVS